MLQLKPDMFSPKPDSPPLVSLPQGRISYHLKLDQVSFCDTLGFFFIAFITIVIR